MESPQHASEETAQHTTKQNDKSANNNTATTTTTSKDLLYVNPHKVNKNLLINNNNNNSNNNNNNNNNPRRTYKIDGSSILDRVKNFIPEIACANDHLSKISAEEKENMNIENVDDDDTNVIEMNINMVDPDLLLSDDEDDSDDSSDGEEDVAGVVCDRSKKMSSNVVIEELQT